MSSIISFLLSCIVAILFMPVALFFKICNICGITAPERRFGRYIDTIMITEEDKEVATALKQYGFEFGYCNYWIDRKVCLSPDSDAYILKRVRNNRVKSSPKYLVLYVADYIESIEYVREAIANDLDMEVIGLNPVQEDYMESDFDKRSPVMASEVYTKPQDWEIMKRYAVDFPPYFFGFLATTRPKNTPHFKLVDWYEVD